MGLLTYLSTHTLDEDYAFVSRRRQERRSAESGEPGERTPEPSRRGVGVVGALVMAVFAVLVVTAAAQTSRNSVSDERERQELVGQVSSARTQVNDDRSRLLSLQTEVTRLREQQLRSDTSASGLLARIDQLGIGAGTVAVAGPGVRVVADDAAGADSASNEVLDTDLQQLVNGLWAAGAEAISIDGQRLTNLSTIRLAGGAITVNARSLRRPYVLNVIGNKDTLPARFAETTSGQAWLDLQRQVGLRLSLTPVSRLRLPATEVSLRYADQGRTGGTP
jgi:uncharacterized protein YlxW (UPF0749 family)